MLRRLAFTFGMVCLLPLGFLQLAARGQSPGVVNLEQSYVVIFVDKEGLGHQHGVIGKLSEGELRLGTKESAGRLVFDMPSFVADTPQARRYVKLQGEIDEQTQKDVTASMLGRRVLDVKKFPTAVFEIKSATPMQARSRNGRPQYSLQGEFTLHGVTKPLSIQAEVFTEKNATRVRGAFYLQQTEYGIKPFTMAFGAVGVADRLTVYGELFLNK
jgi:polyisoprenoid-binding protein YceI